MLMLEDLFRSFVRHSCRSSVDAIKFKAKNLGRGIFVAPRTFIDLQQKDRRVHEYVCSLNYFGYFGAI